MPNFSLRRHMRAVLTGVLTMLTLLAHAQQKGKASYYSKRAHGARTSSGVRLNNDSLVCAHRTHPFGTLLHVRNLANGREVVVKVIDRGPFLRGRIIDVSYAAAKALGMLAAGVQMVEVSTWHPRIHIPYKPEPISLPELDLGISETIDSVSYTAPWHKNKKTN